MDRKLGGPATVVYRDPHLTLKLCQVQGFLAPIGNKFINYILGYGCPYGCHYMPSIIMTSTCDQSVMYYSWSILYNVGPALKQHWICVFYLYCYRLVFV